MPRGGRGLGIAALTNLAVTPTLGPSCLQHTYIPHLFFFYIVYLRSKCAKRHVMGFRFRFRFRLGLRMEIPHTHTHTNANKQTKQTSKQIVHCIPLFSLHRMFGLGSFFGLFFSWFLFFFYPLGRLASHGNSDLDMVRAPRSRRMDLREWMGWTGVGDGMGVKTSGVGTNLHYDSHSTSVGGTYSARATRWDSRDDWVGILSATQVP